MPKEGEGCSLIWPIRVCAAAQGIVLVTLSKTRCIILCEYVLIIYGY